MNVDKPRARQIKDRWVVRKIHDPCQFIPHFSMQQGAGRSLEEAYNNFKNRPYIYLMP